MTSFTQSLSLTLKKRFKNKNQYTAIRCLCPSVKMIINQYTYNSNALPCPSVKMIKNQYTYNALPYPCITKLLKISALIIAALDRVSVYTIGDATFLYKILLLHKLTHLSHVDSSIVRVEWLKLGIYFYLPIWEVFTRITPIKVQNLNKNTFLWLVWLKMV